MDGSSLDQKLGPERGQGGTAPPHKDLYTLLDHPPWTVRLTEEDKEKIDNNAIIKELQRDPKAAERKCPFSYNREYAFPLHQAIKLGVSLEVLDALYQSYPQAVRVKGQYTGFTPLHIACVWGEPLEVVSYLYKKWPAAIEAKDIHGNTPLHRACRYNDATMDAVSFLLEEWPDAVKERNNIGEKPLDLAKKYALKDVRDIVHYVSELLSEEETTIRFKGEALLFFDKIKWPFGVALILDKCPDVSRTFDVDNNTKSMPDFFSFVGRHCKIRTMWSVMLNKQELLAGI